MLLDLPPGAFIGNEQRSTHYSMSAFLVRYLLASDHFAGPFRAFLAAVATGEHADAGILLALLDTDWTELEAGFGKWLASADATRGPKGKKR